MGIFLTPGHQQDMIGDPGMAVAKAVNFNAYHAPDIGGQYPLWPGCQKNLILKRSNFYRVKRR